jgi:ribosomal subunit interface protein
MRIQLSAKQVEIGEPLKSRIEQRLDDGIGKYFANPIEAHVAFSRENLQVRADCSVHIGQGMHVQAHAATDSAAQAFEAACDRLEKRLRRYKRRLRDHRARERQPETELQAQSYVLAAEDDDAPEPADGFQPVVVAESTTDIHTLTVGEAVMRLDLSEAPVVVFRNAGHGGTNVVYRRADGHVGWIDLAAAPTGAAPRHKKA